MTALSPATVAKLAKVLPRLATDSDGEVIATVAAVKRVLASGGHDIHDLTEALTAPPPPPIVVWREAPQPRQSNPFSRRPHHWRDGLDPNRRWTSLVLRCRLAPGRLSPWETTFLDSLKGRLDRGGILTERQRDRLLEIAAKLGLTA